MGVTRGVNTEGKVTYANVVRGLAKVGTWDGAPARFEVPLATARAGDADSYVVLLQGAQANGPGGILGAARAPAP